MLHKFEVYSNDVVFTATFDPDIECVRFYVDDVGIGLDSDEIEALSKFIKTANKVIKSRAIKRNSL